MLNVKAEFIAKDQLSLLARFKKVVNDYGKVINPLLALLVSQVAKKIKIMNETEGPWICVQEDEFKNKECDVILSTRACMQHSCGLGGESPRGASFSSHDVLCPVVCDCLHAIEFFIYADTSLRLRLLFCSTGQE